MTLMVPDVLTIKRLRVLIMARLLIGAMLLFYAHFVFPVQRVVFYSLIAAVLALSVIYLLWLMAKFKLSTLITAQIAIDLILESILVFFTGSADSMFSSIYILSILSAGYVFSPVSSFFVAGGSSILVLATVVLDYLNIPSVSVMGSSGFSWQRDIMYLFYASYVRITVFFIVAFLTYYFSGMIQKLEDNMRIQERLAVLGEVVSNIAHEIKNPLASISGSVELISKQIRSQLNPNQLKLMEAVVEESNRVKRIFTGLLDYSRIPKLDCEIISVESFLEQVLLLIRHQEGFNPNVEIIPRFQGSRINMFVDPEYMKQAVMNILVNAFQAMPNGGRLEVDCCRLNGEVRISIQDTGEGMSQKELDFLFIPFKTNKANGTGLGMAQAHKVVQQHGGRLVVHSKKRSGTRVELFVPSDIE